MIFNFHITKKEIPFFKEKHSMAFILSKNIVFIAGGGEDSFYYDINSKEFITWGKMNGIQEKPALIEFEDYLFSINSFMILPWLLPLILHFFGCLNHSHC